MATANHTFRGGTGTKTEIMAAVVLTRNVRSRLEAQITAFLDNAKFLLDLLDPDDAQHPDMEPNVDGEAEPDEAIAKAVTLSSDRSQAVTYRPGARQQCAANRRNGDVSGIAALATWLTFLAGYVWWQCRCDPPG